MCILIDVNNRLKIQLEPLALVANIIQAAHCCLDHVLLTLGFLYHTYRNLQGHEFAVPDDLRRQMEDYLNENNLFAGMSVSYTTMETSLKQEVCF